MKKERTLFISYGLIILAITSFINANTLVAIISLILAFSLLTSSCLTYRFAALLVSLLLLLMQILTIVIFSFSNPMALFIIATYNSLLLYSLLVNNYETTKLFNLIIIVALVSSIFFLAISNSILTLIFQQVTNIINYFIPLFVILLIPFILYDLYLITSLVKTKKLNHKIKLSDSF